MKLSDLKCRKASASERRLKLADGEGLFLHVYPNGKKLWRLSYRHAGKQRDLAFGPYPHMGKRFRAGILLHDGAQVLPFGDRLWSAPVSTLWA